MISNSIYKFFSDLFLHVFFGYISILLSSKPLCECDIFCLFKAYQHKMICVPFEVFEVNFNLSKIDNFK